MARAAPESRQQARTIAYSLARALRALAGGLSWERLGRIALLGNASDIPSQIAPGSLPGGPPRGARREWREPPEDGDSKPVRSLMPLRGRWLFLLLSLLSPCLQCLYALSPRALPVP